MTLNIVKLISGDVPSSEDDLADLPELVPGEIGFRSESPPDVLAVLARPRVPAARGLGGGCRILRGMVGVALRTRFIEPQSLDGLRFP